MIQLQCRVLFRWRQKHQSHDEEQDVSTQERLFTSYSEEMPGGLTAEQRETNKTVEGSHSHIIYIYVCVCAYVCRKLFEPKQNKVQDCEEGG